MTKHEMLMPQSLIHDLYQQHVHLSVKYLVEMVCALDCPQLVVAVPSGS